MTRWCLILTFVIPAAISSSAVGQSNSLFGSQQPFNPNSGATLSPGRTSGSSTGLGGLSLTQGGTGGLTAMGALQLSPTGSAAFQGSSSEFVGRSNTSFVGSRMAGQSGMTGPTGARTGGLNQSQRGFQQSQPFMQRTQQFQQPMGQNNFPQMNNFGNFGGMNFGQQAAVQIRQRISFSYAQPQARDVATTLSTRFQKIAPSRTELRGVAFGVDDQGTVTLRGTVPNDEARLLAEMLARLEPGVREVRSELTVAR